MLLDSAGPKGYPSYEFDNLSGNLSRLRKRLSLLQGESFAAAQMPSHPDSPLATAPAAAVEAVPASAGQYDECEAGGPPAEPQKVGGPSRSEAVAPVYLGPTAPGAEATGTSPGVVDIHPLPPRDPNRGDVEGPLYIGPVSAQDRARVARDDCPIPDGEACITMMRPDDLLTDAKTFQYKEATDTDGVSVKLRDVKKWDADLAGIAYVWERADGRRFIVDGHQRLALAKRMQAQGQDPVLLVKFWREADGYTPRYMRLAAAKKNIAEDSGTAVDAARVLREDPNLFDTLSQTGAKVRDAKGLAKLTLPVFNEAVEYINAGRLPENVAAVVSRVGENQEMQRGVLLELVRAQRDGHLTPDEAGQMVYVVRRSTLDDEAQKLQGVMPSFDVGAVRESAWRERDALTRGVLNAFKGTRLVLRAVERGRLSWSTWETCWPPKRMPASWTPRKRVSQSSRSWPSHAAPWLISWTTRPNGSRNGWTVTA